MANNNHPDQPDWIDERLTKLDQPDELQLDVARGWARLQTRKRLAARRTRLLWTMTTMVAVVIGLFALPWPRAAAQRVWDRLVLGRIAVITADRQGVPESVLAAFTLERKPIDGTAVSDVAEAERIAGFRPLLPSRDVMSAVPQLSVVTQASLSTRPLSTRQLEQALAAAGITDMSVPKEWEGITLTAEGGPVVMAHYPNGVEVLQAPPFKMMTPPGFPIGRFMEMAFRVFGRQADEARRLGAKFEENPALVLHFPEHEPVIDVALRSGQAILVGKPDGSDGICFFWNTPDRIFVLSADNMNQDQAARLADSVH